MARSRDARPGCCRRSCRILRRLLEREYIEANPIGTRHRYSATENGLAAREQDRIDVIDPRQLTLLEQELFEKTTVFVGCQIDINYGKIFPKKTEAYSPQID